jgi:segregation and condensation protein A
VIGPTFALDNFEGPLELLLYLIQKEEIDICAVAIKKLTQQFMDDLEKRPEVEISSETLSLAATLLLLKSQKLLPQEENQTEIDEDPRIEMIQNLIEYCRFKETAKMLSSKEEEEKAYFPRQALPVRKEVGSGLEEVGIENLKALLQEMLKRSQDNFKQIIQEEEWQISDKLAWLQHLLSNQKSVLFASIFSNTKSRIELIVLFLALLEMMKHQEAQVVRENESLYIIRTDYASRA